MDWVECQIITYDLKLHFLYCYINNSDNNSKYPPIHFKSRKQSKAKQSRTEQNGTKLDINRKSSIHFDFITFIIHWNCIRDESIFNSEIGIKTISIHLKHENSINQSCEIGKGSNVFLWRKRRRRQRKRKKRKKMQNAGPGNWTRISNLASWQTPIVLDTLCYLNDLLILEYQTKWSLFSYRSSLFSSIGHFLLNVWYLIFDVKCKQFSVQKRGIFSYWENNWRFWMFWIGNDLNYDYFIARFRMDLNMFN